MKKIIIAWALFDEEGKPVEIASTRKELREMKDKYFDWYSGTVVKKVEIKVIK